MIKVVRETGTIGKNTVRRKGGKSFGLNEKKKVKAELRNIAQEATKYHRASDSSEADTMSTTLKKAVLGQEALEERKKENTAL